MSSTTSPDTHPKLRLRDIHAHRAAARDKWTVASIVKALAASDPVLAVFKFALWNEASTADEMPTRCVELTVLFASRAVLDACRCPYTGLHMHDDIQDGLLDAARRKYLPSTAAASDWTIGEDMRYGGGSPMTAWFHDEASLSIAKNKSSFVDLFVNADEDEEIFTSSARVYLSDGPVYRCMQPPQLTRTQE